MRGPRIESCSDRDDKKFENVRIVMEQGCCEVVATSNRTAESESVTKNLANNDGIERVTSFMNLNETVKAPKKMNKNKYSRKKSSR